MNRTPASNHRDKKVERGLTGDHIGRMSPPAVYVSGMVWLHRSPTPAEGHIFLTHGHFYLSQQIQFEGEGGDGDRSRLNIYGLKIEL